MTMFPPDGPSSDLELSAGLSPPKFPHTRAQLCSFARLYKPIDNYDSDGEDDMNRVPSALVNRIVALLINEEEDELKDLLKDRYGMDDDTLEHSVLELMHKHRDDIAGVPFLFLTPTRRPISRPSSRASNHSGRLHPARPDTPQSASAPNSPLAHLFRRPHTPLTSPLASGATQANSYMVAKSDYSASPSSSPVLSFAPTTMFTASLPASPLSSPRLLNAKASEFKPIQRPLSAAAMNPPRTETPSPDLWSHNPFRATSNLAIAAPLLPEQSFHSNSSLRSSLRPDDLDSDDDDPFDPFPSNKEPPLTFVSVSDYDIPWSNSSNSNSSLSAEDPRSLDLHSHFQNPYNGSYGEPSPQTPEMEAEAAGMLTDGMTPFDVLSSVFGSTLAPSELEEALAANAYDFERAMAWLVDRALPPQPQASQIRTQNLGGRITLVSGGPPRSGRGYQPSSPGRAPRYTNGRTPGSGNRVCRYFVAGECLRADCRFSHDLERALCRFWLRGTCAKNEACEFLHHLPKDVDISSLNLSMGRTNLGGAMSSPPLGHHNPPPEDFPVLGGYDANTRRVGYNDPGRTRFANAVKKPAPQVNDAQRREIMGSSADNIHHKSAIVAPRPSPRLKLRPSELIPTLPTGEAVNSLYMTYRSRALQLGGARNACLSRAADAWRRGDGAAAKRFSREGQELNAKMAAEMCTAAAKLCRERAVLTEQAVRARDLSWSDDPGDRTSRGKSIGGSLGVCLGIARRDIGDGKLSPEERTEALLDLHGLHANEATEVLEEFLLALEHEHFYGLAYVIVGEEKHVGTQDVARGASRIRLATGVREWVHRWGYPWMERDGILCLDPLTHASE